MSKTDAYEALVKLKDERPNALFLDLGCCFGNDVRKVVSDGWPVGQCVASDLRPGKLAPRPAFPTIFDYIYLIYKS